MRIEISEAELKTLLASLRLWRDTIEGKDKARAAIEQSIRATAKPPEVLLESLRQAVDLLDRLDRLKRALAA